jgi:hypothetical protein
MSNHLPRIRLLKISCARGAEYKVRMERIGEGEPFECEPCGAQIAVRPFAGVLELLHRYSELVLRIEEDLEIEGDRVTPKKQGVTVGPSLAK